MHSSVVAGVAASALMLASTLVWLDARQEREYRRLIAAGDGAAAAGDTSGAIEAFSGALALTPDSMSARLKRGDTYLRRGELESAVRDLGEAVALDPTAVRALERLGDALAAAGRQAEAAARYRRYLEIDDRAPRVEYKLGVSYYRAGRIAESIGALQRAVALEERFAEAHYALALGLRASGPEEAAGAERALVRAVEIDGSLAAAREELAALYTADGRQREALEQLEALAALEPGRPERLVAVGLAHARLGRHERAVQVLARAAERHPDAAVVDAALGRIWLDAAERGYDPTALDRALEALAPVAVQPDAGSDALTFYGRALQLSGDLERAGRVLERATTRFPVEPLAFAYLAEVAEQAGNDPLARGTIARHAALAVR